MTTSAARFAVIPAVAFLAASAVESTAQTDRLTEQQIRDRIRDQFTPSRPALTVSYDVSYRFMGINLMKVAVATIESVEGTWKGSDGSDSREVCITEFRFETIENGTTGEQGRVYLRDSMLSVLTLPDLNTLWYMRRADERISIPLIAKKRVDYLDAYDMESGPLRYYREDYLDGSVTTNLPGIESFAEQGREISSVVKLISSIYYGREQVIGDREPYMIKANIDGKIVPLAVLAQNSESPVRFEGEYPCATKISVRRVNGEKPGGECFVMWASSLRDVVCRTKNEALAGVADVLPEWSMVPLVADYDLCVGGIRCGVTGIGLSCAVAGPAREEPDDSASGSTPVGMLSLDPP